MTKIICIIFNVHAAHTKILRRAKKAIIMKWTHIQIIMNCLQKDRRKGQRKKSIERKRRRSRKHYHLSTIHSSAGWLSLFKYKWGANIKNWEKNEPTWYFFYFNNIPLLFVSLLVAVWDFYHDFFYIDSSNSWFIELRLLLSFILRACASIIGMKKFLNRFSSSWGCHFLTYKTRAGQKTFSYSIDLFLLVR